MYKLFFWSGLGLAVFWSALSAAAALGAF